MGTPPIGASKLKAMLVVHEARNGTAHLTGSNYQDTDRIRHGPQCIAEPGWRQSKTQRPHYQRSEPTKVRWSRDQV
jgi:hypothetical protein